MLASRYREPMEGLLGCHRDSSQEGLQRKWFSFRLTKSNKDSGKTGCRGKVSDPELVMCASWAQKVTTHSDIF